MIIAPTNIEIAVYAKKMYTSRLDTVPAYTTSDPHE
jgi:hypothetical protein